jgi:hypothetical protein
VEGQDERNDKKTDEQRVIFHFGIGKSGGRRLASLLQGRELREF